MCCFLVALFAFGPRLAFLIYWLLQPAYISSVFNTWIWPLLGPGLPAVDDVDVRPGVWLQWDRGH